jgi:hypothetical protein
MVTGGGGSVGVAESPVVRESGALASLPLVRIRLVMLLMRQRVIIRQFTVKDPLGRCAVVAVQLGNVVVISSSCRAKSEPRVLGRPPVHYTCAGVMPRKPVTAHFMLFPSFAKLS